MGLKNLVSNLTFGLGTGIYCIVSRYCISFIIFGYVNKQLYYSLVAGT